MRALKQEGGHFKIGDVTLRVEETEPAPWKASAPAWKKASAMTGGVRCKVISGGHIAIGDSVFTKTEQLRL